MSGHERTLAMLAQIREATAHALLLDDNNDENFIAIKLAECLDSINDRVRIMTNWAVFE